jgi:MFS family permease
MRPHPIIFLYQAADVACLMIIPLFAAELGATSFEIGIIGTCYGIAIFLSSYLFGKIGDVYTKKFVIMLGLLASSLTFGVQMFAEDLLSLALVRFLVGFSVGIFPPALTAYAYESKSNFGRFLSFGPLGMAVGCFLAGLIAVYYRIFAFSSLCMVLTFFVASTLTPTETKKKPRMNSRKHLIKKDFWIYLAFFLRHTGANSVWIILPLFIEEIGGNIRWIGFLYTMNYVVQVILMNALGRLKTSKLVLLGTFSSTLGFLGYAIARNPYHLIPIELMIGLSWASLWVGMNTLLLERNEEHSTVIGLFTSTQFLSVSFGPFIGGAIAQLFGYRATMMFAAVLSFASFVVFKVKASS